MDYNTYTSMKQLLANMQKETEAISQVCEHSNYFTCHYASM